MKLSLHIIINDDQQAAQFFAKLVGQIKSSQPDDFDFLLVPGQKPVASNGGKAHTNNAANRKQDAKPRKEPFRFMGELKREAFELLEKDKENYLTVAEAGRLCGYKTDRFKSTLT